MFRTFGAATDFLNSLRSAERQSNLAARNVVLSRVDANEPAADALQRPLRGVPHGGNGAASAQFNHGQVGRGFGQSVEPHSKAFMLRLSSVTEPRRVAEHQDVGAGQRRAISASG